MAKYNITKEWSEPFKEFYYTARKYDTHFGRWVILFSEKSLDKAEERLLDLKNTVEIKPEIIKEYEF